MPDNNFDEEIKEIKQNAEQGLVNDTNMGLRARLRTQGQFK